MLSHTLRLYPCVASSRLVITHCFCTSPPSTSSAASQSVADTRKTSPILTQNDSVPKSESGSKENETESEESVTESKVPFATMLRNSKLFQLGDPRGKIVSGIVEHTMGNDLYIDFGGKFPCVCKRPQKNEEEYVRGAHVLIRLLDLELSSRFLGSDRDLTLCEADAILIGLRKRRRENRNTENEEDKIFETAEDLVDEITSDKV